MSTRSRMTAIAGAAALALALTGCAGETEGDAATPVDDVTIAATGGETPSGEETARPGMDENHNDADVEFAQRMIVHHEGAVEMADLAAQKTENDEVRVLAEGISAAQGPEIEQMTSFLEAWGEPTSAEGDMEGMDHGMEMEGMSQEEAMAELESLDGTEFDRRFLELMIAHHEGAIEMAQTQVDEGENAQAVALAHDIHSDQEAEILDMEEMLADL